MPMIAAIELDDLVAPGEAASESNGGHRGLRAGIAHADFLNTWHPGTDKLRQAYLERVWNTKACTVFGRRPHRLNDFWRGMAQDSGAPGADIINVLIAVDIPDQGPFCFVNKKGLPAYR